MGYVYFTKGRPTKVSEHFFSTEFDCHGVGCCTKTIVNEKLIEYLEKIRTHFNAPITITSPYRCPVHNSRPSVGGAPGSRHTKGDAADIVVKGVAPKIVAQYAESIGILGIGLYETASDGYFVHIDTRDYKSFWYGQKQYSRSTFGAYSGAISSNANSSNTSKLDTVLDRGDNGAAVKAMQEKLILLGYSCGDRGADGDFGGATFNAVVRFQRDNNLGDDGIAGNLTLTVLDKRVAERVEKESAETGSSYKAKVTASLLNVRSGAGTKFSIISQIKMGYECLVVEEKDGWCKIKNPSGWVSKEYIKKN